MDSGQLWDRLGALSGLAAIGLIVAYITVGDVGGDPAQPSTAIAAAMVGNRDEARLAASLGMAGVFLLFWFLGYLRRHLRRAEGDDGWLAAVAHGGGLVAAGLMLVSISFTLAESVIASPGADAQVAKTFLVYSWEFAGVLAPPLGALLAASCVVGLRFRALPLWLSGFGLLIVVGMVVLPPGLGAGVALLWIAMASLVLFVRTWRPAPLGSG